MTRSGAAAVGVVLALVCGTGCGLVGSGPRDGGPGAPTASASTAPTTTDADVLRDARRRLAEAGAGTFVIDTRSRSGVPVGRTTGRYRLDPPQIELDSLGAFGREVGRVRFIALGERRHVQIVADRGVVQELGSCWLTGTEVEFDEFSDLVGLPSLVTGLDVPAAAAVLYDAVAEVPGTERPQRSSEAIPALVPASTLLVVLDGTPQVEELGLDAATTRDLDVPLRVDVVDGRATGWTADLGDLGDLLAEEAGADLDARARRLLESYDLVQTRATVAPRRRITPITPPPQDEQLDVSGADAGSAPCLDQ